MFIFEAVPRAASINAGTRPRVCCMNAMNLDSSNNKTRVLVVDDSALMSRQITNILNSASDLTVIGRAKDGLEALSMVDELKPDVITLDVEMPNMNGITALKHIMVKHSTPTVMISALTTEGATTTFDALKYGAIDVIAKPSRREDESLEAQEADIIAKVRRAAAIRTGRLRYVKIRNNDWVYTKQGHGKPEATTRFIGIGTGTGGYYSLLKIVPALPSEFNDVMIAVVLLAARYIEPFANYLDAHSAVPVKTAEEVTVLERGTCYICSNQNRLILHSDGDGVPRLEAALSAHTENGEAAIDQMFGSLARTVGDKAVAVVLTGPGCAGAQGLAEVRKAGGIGIVQDINNCVDPSMPIAALELGSVERILPDYLMADFLLNLTQLGV